MATIYKCKKHGLSISPYCTDCGLKCDVITLPKCECGETITPLAKYCGKCGARVNIK